METLYDGIVKTDEHGIGVVALPRYFEALNRDFKYQLAVIRMFAQAIIKQETTTTISSSRRTSRTCASRGR